MIDEGCKKLEIYQLAHRLAIEVHALTLKLPKYELYEEGNQIRRSSKSVPAQIVEGYCVRRHKNEFLQFLTRAYASAQESIEHLELMFECGSLADEAVYKRLREEYELLCKKTFRFIQGVLNTHDTPFYVKDDGEAYLTEDANR